MKINWRKLLSLLGVSPAVLAGSPALAGPAKAKTSVNSGGGKIHTLNPKGMPPAIQLVPMAPRLDSLDGKTTEVQAAPILSVQERERTV